MYVKGAGLTVFCKFSLGCYCRACRCLSHSVLERCPFCLARQCMFNVSDIIHGATGLRCQRSQTPAPVHYSPRQPLETVRKEFNGAV